MIILVASENAGTGKTTLVTNLAVWLKKQKQNNNVVIVDDTQTKVAAKWVRARNKISDVKGKLIKCITECNNFIKELKQLNEKYDRVIVDCESGISLESDLFLEFDSAASVANMVIFPFRASPKDFYTLPLIVKHIKEAKEDNPKLVACAVIICSETDLSETEIDEVFAEHVDTVTLIKPFIHDRDMYQQALNEGYSVIEMNDEEAEAEIRELNSALVKIYNNRNKILPAPTEVSETDEEGSTQEQGLETVPSAPDTFLSSTNFSPQKFSSQLKSYSIEQLAKEYLSINKQSQIMKGLILLEAKKRYPSNKDFGKWVDSIITLSDDSYQQRNLYMNLARFFKNRDMTGISITAAYNISKPSNKDVAKAVYKKVHHKNFSVEEVDEIIKEEKSKLGLLPISSEKLEIIVDEEKVNEVLKQISGFNLPRNEQIELLRQCISSIKAKQNDVIDSELGDS
jgi:cellulose biosynthesis protein BcsQ